MRFGYVEYVNIISQAGSIGRRIVISVNLEERALSCGSLQQQGDDMRLGVVIFADSGSCTTRVKITEGNHRPAVRDGVPVERTLERELGFAVRVNRIFRMIFI